MQPLQHRPNTTQEPKTTAVNSPAFNMSSEKLEYRPKRTENILDDSSNFVARSAMSSSNSSAEVEVDDKDAIERTETGKSNIERQFEPVKHGDREKLHRIASEFGGSVALSRTQTRGSVALEKIDTLHGVKLGDSVLDPSSPDFDVYKWTRMVMRLIDENEVIERRAGIVWKQLKVCGSGSAINLQKNVGSLLLAPLRFREFFSKGPEKTILNEFDGVLKSGEMLVVLGRPGSGCSTLLKTLMGELHGLDMKSQSEIHYNGKSTPSTSLSLPSEFF